MQKKATSKYRNSKEEISGSETITEKIKSRVPWVFGSKIRNPRIIYPKLKLPRMDVPIPGKSIMFIVVYVALFLLQMGIIYLIYREPPAIGANSAGDPQFLAPDISEAYIIESIVASILILMNSAGFILLYQASKYVYNKRMAIYILVVGIIMVAITFVVLQMFITIKLGQPLFGV